MQLSKEISVSEKKREIRDLLDEAKATKAHGVISFIPWKSQRGCSDAHDKDPFSKDLISISVSKDLRSSL